MTRRLHWILATAFILLSVSLGMADEVLLKNGDRLTGEVLSLQDQQLLLHTEYAGVMTIAWSAVKSLQTDKAVSVKLTDGSEADAVVHWKEGEWDLSQPDGELLQRTDAILGIGLPDPVASTSGWTGEAALSMSLQSGNVDKFAANLSGAVKKELDRSRVSLYVGYETADDDGETTLRRWKGGGRYEIDFNEKTYAFFGSDFLHDKFKDLDLRSTFSSGLGRHWIRHETLTVDVEAGAAFILENLKEGDDDEYLSGRFGETLQWQINKRSRLIQKLEWLPNIEEFDNWTANFDMTLDTKLNDHWSIRTSYRMEYDNQAPDVDPGKTKIKNTDHFLQAAIVFSF